MMLKTRKTTLALALTLGWLALPALAQDYKEPPLFADLPQDKKLPPMAERLPRTPIVVGSSGRYGGDIVTLVPRPRDIRYISTYTYTRLVGYDRNLDLQPDLLERFENQDDRV